MNGVADLRKESVKHEHLKAVMCEILDLLDDVPCSVCGDGSCDDEREHLEAFERDSKEPFERLEAEILHSSLIVAGDVSGNTISMATVPLEDEIYGLLFTDMDEFRKVYPAHEVESRMHPFGVYFDMLKKSKLDGFIINLKSECFILPLDSFEENTPLPEYEYSPRDSYTSHELKRLRDQMNNESLKEFIHDPHNIGRYEELFEMISSSTVLTLLVSREDLGPRARDGVISMSESGTLGSCYVDRVGGNYATIYTSEDEMADVETGLNKYSQIVNFSQMTYSVLSDDLDGIIINPKSDNILLTRDILLKFSQTICEKCNNPKLNSAIFHMFPMEV